MLKSKTANKDRSLTNMFSQFGFLKIYKRETNCFLYTCISGTVVYLVILSEVHREI